MRARHTDMMVDGRAPALAVAREKRVEHGIVGAGDHVRIVVEMADDRDAETHLVGEFVIDTQQPGIAGERADQAVEGEVLFYLPAGIAAGFVDARGLGPEGRRISAVSVAQTARPAWRSRHRRRS